MTHTSIDSLLNKIRTDDEVSQARSLRRWLHAHPELSFEEHQTAALVAAVLRQAGYEVIEGVGGTGIIGILRRGEGRCIAIRADMDALPISEQTQKDYRSKCAGVMHACGHDGHTAILLGAALRLAKADLSGTLVLIFQPAEETGEGAKAMLASGLLKEFDLAGVFGLHNWPDLPVGQIALHRGPVMASADRFQITITGKSFHPALPAQGDDIMAAASSAVLAIQESFLRRRTTTSPSTLTVSEFVTDGQRHATPGEVRLSGTIRCLDGSTRTQALQWIDDIAQASVRRYGGKAETKIVQGCPCTINSRELRPFLRKAAIQAVGEENVIEDIDPSMGGDDFAYFLDGAKGAYYWLGTGSEQARPLHSPEFDFDDNALEAGIHLWENLARQFLS